MVTDSTLTASGTLTAGADPASGAASGTGNGYVDVDTGGLVSAAIGTLYAGGTISLDGGTVTTAGGLTIETGALLVGAGNIGGAVTDLGQISTAPGLFVFGGDVGGSGGFDV
ncbi:MAG TPA: hypothetical protein VGF84_24075, partial [Micromonosporaceae bacterium]